VKKRRGERVGGEVIRDPTYRRGVRKKFSPVLKVSGRCLFIFWQRFV
jgi:hypothetical protein